MLAYREAWYNKELNYQDRLDLACKMVRLEHSTAEAAGWFARAFKESGLEVKAWKCTANEFEA